MSRSLPKILIVDDEPEVLFVLARSLNNEEYEVHTAHNGTEAIEKLGQNSYHVVLLDLNMHPVSGMDVLKDLRKSNQETVVIIFTAFSTVDSAIEALRLGAFDYLIKPAEPAAIRQRVEEGVKRYDQSIARIKLRDQLSTLQQTLQMINADAPASEHQTTSDRILRRGELLINLDSRHARFSDVELTLTTTEYKILVCLAEACPRPVDPVALAQAGLGYFPSQNEASELVKYHIHNLRQKIESKPDKPKHIKTIRYEGYVWCE